MEKIVGSAIEYLQTDFSIGQLPIKNMVTCWERADLLNLVCDV